MDKIFLLNLKIQGIKNIEKEIELQFYKKGVSQNDFDTTDYNVKAIYGENGAGKTAIITAVQTLIQLIRNKKYLSDSRSLILLNELINKKTNSSTISCEFVIDKNYFRIYRYSISLIRNNENDITISNEQMAYRSSSSSAWKTVYKIDNNKFVEFGFSKSLLAYVDNITKNLLQTQSFVSILNSEEAFKELCANAEKNNKERVFVDSIFDILVFSRRTYAYLDTDDQHISYVSNQMFHVLDEKRPRIIPQIDFIKVADVVVSKEFLPKYKETISNLYQFIKIFKPELKNIEVDARETNDKFICNLIFVYDSYQLFGEFESTGVKKLVRVFTALQNIDRGNIVFIDEFDANIHDVYLCKILEYFIQFSSGQLCFTTHNLGPMEVLDKSKKSIDFLARDCSIVPWHKNGHYSVRNLYSKGMIDKSPFNIEPFSFLGIFHNSEE